MEAGIEAIGYVTDGRADRRDDGWGRVHATIELVERLGAEALIGLDAFSHVEVVFRFHGLTDDETTTGARHPRGNTDWPQVGIFAQRASKRPNRIGVTVCELLAVADRRVHVCGLDAVDGTPVLDIKPVMRAFLPRGQVIEPTWVTELMAGYWDGPEVDNDS